MAYLPVNSTPASLVSSIIRDDDGAHVKELLKLLKLSGAHENPNGEEAMKILATRTEDFEKWYQDFINRL